MNALTRLLRWAVLAVVALLFTTWTSIVRSLEERKGSSAFDTWCRAVGRIMMLGVGSTPVYPKPPAPTPTIVTIPDSSVQ